jgi:hypothetical protein
MKRLIFILACLAFTACQPRGPITADRGPGKGSGGGDQKPTQPISMHPGFANGFQVVQRLVGVKLDSACKTDPCDLSFYYSSAETNPRTSARISLRLYNLLQTEVNDKDAKSKIELEVTESASGQERRILAFYLGKTLQYVIADQADKARAGAIQAGLSLTKWTQAEVEATFLYDFRGPAGKTFRVAVPKNVHSYLYENDNYIFDPQRPYWGLAYNESWQIVGIYFSNYRKILFLNQE